jgi:hypothetical protein
MKSLSRLKIVSFGKPMYHKVFQDYRGATEQPFSEDQKERFLLFPCDFLLSKDVANSLAVSAKSNSENFLLVTYIVSPEYEKENNQKFWLIDFSELEELWKEIGPVEYALFSIKGDWGVIFSYERFALLGCTKEFACILRENFPEIDTQIFSFLEYWKDYEKEPYISTTWIPPLLSHLYGIEKTKELLLKTGSNFD